MIHKKNIHGLMVGLLLTAGSSAWSSDNAAPQKHWMRWGLTAGVVLGSFGYQMVKEWYDKGKDESKYDRAGDVLNYVPTPYYVNIQKAPKNYTSIFDLRVNHNSWHNEYDTTHQLYFKCKKETANNLENYDKLTNELKDYLKSDSEDSSLEMLQKSYDVEGQYGADTLTIDEKIITVMHKIRIVSQYRINARKKDGHKRTAWALAKSLALGALVYNMRGL